MYYQALPGHTEWAPSCAWGHAVSDDLVVWEEREPALVAGSFELGCWSGCFVADRCDGGQAFYTRVGFGDQRVGKIAVATGDPSGHFVSSVDATVINDPPIALEHFRDPYVWRDPDGWTMIVGGGTVDGDGVLSLYRSEDLDRWTYAGVLVRGRVPGVGAGHKQVWECPQMMRVGSRWVLVVSVSVADAPAAVAACAGSYDGVRFAHGDWRRLVYGGVGYATSLFRDRDGRPCMISWLREDSLVRPGAWAGAHSLVARLALDSAGHVTIAPYPAVRSSHVFTHVSHVASIEMSAGVATHATVADAIEIRREGRCLARIATSPHDAVVVGRPGRTAETMPGDPGGAVELVVDADILEVFSAGSYGAWRLVVD